jgi:hypothetical protein
MRRYLLSTAIISILTAVVFLFGCSEDVFIGTHKANQEPEIWLSSGPVEGDTTGYQVHFYWGGWDPDGEIAFYEFVVVDGNPIGFNPEDTMGIDKWTATAAHDSVFRVSADESKTEVTINNNLYTKYDKTHTFFLRGVDLLGKRSSAMHRSFTAWTLAPYVVIESPDPSQTVLSRVIRFTWVGRDPIDDPSNTQDPDSIRYLWGLVIDTLGNYNPGFNMPFDMNANPARYENKWQSWIYYRAEGDSGRSTIIGDDEVLEINLSHVFAVQAKDEAGAVTSIFTRGVNFRQFIVSARKGPSLTIFEPFLGVFRFIGTNLTPEKSDLPPAIPLNFRWWADASTYGGQIVGYRYGWDVADISNPSDWAVSYSPFNTAAPERKLYSGTHTFFVEVIDNAGTTALAQIEINIIPFTMERNLLWVDDFYSTNFTQRLYIMPTENEHDTFWKGLCAKAAGFDPEIDIYDAATRNFRAAEISLIGKYKNIIWTYSSDLETNTWSDIVYFMPESQVSTGTELTVNYLSIFLAKGGHMLTLGRSDRAGGLASILSPLYMSFPMSLKCEITGNQTGCDGDTSGVNCMGYKDYCVTMLDKIDAVIRQDEDMPTRKVTKFDAMAYAYKDNNDPITATYPDLPAEFRLSALVTQTGAFWNPLYPGGPGGFTYVEIYNPEYWMNLKFTQNQRCFHPMYRMRTASSISALDRTTVGIWVTKYQEVVPDIPPESGLALAAASFHLGFPLWFMDPAQSNQFIDVVFNEWGIRAAP